MKKYVFLFALALSFSGCSGSASKGGDSIGGDGGEGGAVIYRDGNYLTFGEAKVQVYPQQLDDVPGLSTDVAFFKRLPLPAEVEGQILSALMPVGARQYYKIDDADLGPDKLQILLEKYRASLGGKIPVDSLRLVAITVESETYLLPEFFQLKDDFARAAILFHEALWVMNPNLDYRLVVASEIHFEQFLRDNYNSANIGFDSKFYQTLKLAFNDPLLGIATAAQYEFSGQPVTYSMVDSTSSKSFSSPSFELQDVIGAEATQAVQDGSLNSNLAFYYLAKMVDANPGSVLWNELLIESKGLGLVTAIRPTGCQSDYCDDDEYDEPVFGVGNENFDLRRSSGTCSIQAPGQGYGTDYTGFGGTGGMIGHPNDGKNGVLVAELLVSQGMQVHPPRAIIEDKEGCQNIFLYWDQDHQPVCFKRCYEQWADDQPIPPGDCPMPPEVENTAVD